MVSSSKNIVFVCFVSSFVMFLSQNMFLTGFVIVHIGGPLFVSASFAPPSSGCALTDAPFNPNCLPAEAIDAFAGISWDDAQNLDREGIGKLINDKIFQRKILTEIWREDVEMQKIQKEKEDGHQKDLEIQRALEIQRDSQFERDNQTDPLPSDFLARVRTGEDEELEESAMELMPRQTTGPQTQHEDEVEESPNKKNSLFLSDYILPFQSFCGVNEFAPHYTMDEGGKYKNMCHLNEPESWKWFDEAFGTGWEKHGLIVHPSNGDSCNGVGILVPDKIHWYQGCDKKIHYSTTKEELEEPPSVSQEQRKQESLYIEPAWKFLALKNYAQKFDMGPQTQEISREDSTEQLTTFQKGLSLLVNKAISATSNGVLNTALVNRRLFYDYGTSVRSSDGAASSDMGGLDASTNIDVSTNNIDVSIVPEIKIAWFLGVPVMAWLRNGDHIVWRRDLKEIGIDTGLDASMDNDALLNDILLSRYDDSMWSKLGLSSFPDEDLEKKRQFVSLVRDICENIAPKLMKKFFSNETLLQKNEELGDEETNLEKIDGENGFIYQGSTVPDKYLKIGLPIGRTDFLLTRENPDGDIQAKLGEIQTFAGFVPEALKQGLGYNGVDGLRCPWDRRLLAKWNEKKRQTKKQQGRQ